MKHFKILLLFSVTLQPLFSKEIQLIMPKEIQESICQKLESSECGSDLNYNYYFRLNDNKFLLFYNLKKANKQKIYKNVLTIVDAQNNWRIANSTIDEEIQEIQRDREGDLWLSTLEMQGRIHPQLYHSTPNGLYWKKIALPKHTPSNDIFEDLEFCLLKDRIKLKFIGLDSQESRDSWSSSYGDTINNHPPHWRHQIESMSCLNTPLEKSASNNDWRLIEGYNPLKIVLESEEPNTTQPIEGHYLIESPREKVEAPSSHFYIQIGTFSRRESVEKLTQALKSIGYKITVREHLKDEASQYRLFLGQFKTKEEAQSGLNDLKNNHSEMKIFQGAFVKKF